MTTPKINTIRRGGARLYVHPDTGEKAIGVTSVLNLLPKTFLQYWRAKSVAEFATANAGTLVQMLLDAEDARDVQLARKAATDWLKQAPQRDTSQSADDGTAVHDLTEKIARGLNPGPIHPDYRPFIDHFQRFLDTYQPKYLFLEETVWHAGYGYAGSFDAIAVIEGETVLLDTKTTRSGVHADVALQMAAYANAEFILRLLDPEGVTDTEPKTEQLPLPDLTGAAVLHLRPEGAQLVPVSIYPEVFEVFVALLEKVRPWDQDLSKKVLGQAIAI